MSDELIDPDDCPDPVQVQVDVHNNKHRNRWPWAVVVIVIAICATLLAMSGMLNYDNNKPICVESASLVIDQPIDILG